MTNGNKDRRDTVLIVEDTADNYEIIQTFLGDIGVLYENAFDGAEAVEMCRRAGQYHYSLILMDIHLPQMGGFEAAEKIRQLGLQVPIIAVTATNKDDTSLEGAGEVFDFILFKPFNYLEFYTAISPYVKNAMAYTSGIDAAFSEVFSEGSDVFSVDPQICDVRQAVSNMGNNPRLFVKHFNNFRNNNADLGARLQTLADEMDFSGVAFLCHSIKGLSGMLGLVNISAHIIRLEELALTPLPRSKEFRKQIDAILDNIREDIRAICQIQF
ncbi:MAG: response regulator [Bacillota bacterium]|nr:response regulator [Bacillota bacterium]